MKVEMKITKIVIREYARLYLGLNDNVLKNETLDSAMIPPSAFQWLEKKAQDENWSGILKFINTTTIMVNQYVGYIETPCGLGIEILPKNLASIIKNKQEKLIEESRYNLQQILAIGIHNTPKKLQVISNLSTRKQPIHEWIFSQFLSVLKIIFLKGIRFDYEKIEEEGSFIRGKLDIKKQIINNLTGKAHLFHIKYDKYTPNRLENRLLATALRIIMQVSVEDSNLKLAYKLSIYFLNIPSELQPIHSLQKWRKSKLLSHYEIIKPWCSLILMGHNPEFMQGKNKGMALLFNMNKLFENYVTQCLKNICNVKEQLRENYLLQCENKDPLFKLIPDLKLNENMIADCKWKIIDQDQKVDRYSSAFDLSQNDLYQICIYGINYLPETGGKVILFYPKAAKFDKTLKFKLNKPDNIELLVIPFPLTWGKAEKEYIYKELNL